jgi:hypothetical protein
MRKASDIDPGPQPNPPDLLSPKRQALQKIGLLKRELANLERTVRRIQEVPAVKRKAKAAAV